MTLLNEVVAQNFSASVNRKKIAVNQAFTLSFKIDGNGNRFSPPNLGKFQVLSGPNQSSSMTYVNGKMTQSLTFSYQLRAKSKKLGVIQIGPASIQSSGKTIKSNTVSVEMVKATQQGQNNNQNNNNITKQLNDNIHLVLTVSKSDLYVGEQLTATYTLYFNANINGLTDYVKVPGFSSFWSQDFELKENNVTQANYKGSRYYKSVIKKVLLTPQKSGELTIERMAVELSARIRVPSRSFFSSHRDIKHTVKSSSKKIKVKALPSGKPATFNGAVGSFTLNSDLSKTEAKTNEAISLTIKVKGNGNLKLFDTPDLDIPPDIETYEPKIKENIKMSSSGNSGTKSFEYVLIPRYAGEYKIPSITFTYFDLTKKRYVNLKTPDYVLNIEGEKKAETTTTGVNYSNKDEITLLGEDVLFIKTSSDPFRDIGRYYFKSGIFYFLIYGPLILLFALIFIFKKHKAFNEDLVLVKRRRASRLTKKRLASAQKHLKENNVSGFYEALSRALWGYFSDKINIPFSEISKEKIASLLAEKNLNGAITNELMEIIDQCEFARFAPGSVSDDLESVYKKAAKTITNIDDKI